MDVKELLDLVRAKRSLRSEAALAEVLGISRTQLSQHRHQRRALDADLIWTIAEVLGKSPAELTAVVEFAAESDPVRRERWRERLAALGVLDAPERGPD